MAKEIDDEEIAAIKTILTALTPLAPESRGNVIDYVFRRLGITGPFFATPAQSMATAAAAQPLIAPPGANPDAPPPTDLRSLTEQKQPKSVNQMLAILAYYLANRAPSNERRDYVVADDIKKYFPQANFRLPLRADQSLVNAKNAGYFDVAGTGQYRLNPVGHNLVTHKLPHGDGSPTRKTRRVKRISAKTTIKKAKA